MYIYYVFIDQCTGYVIQSLTHQGPFASFNYLEQTAKMQCLTKILVYQNQAFQKRKLVLMANH